MNTAAGRARFTNVKLNRPGAEYTLVASTSALGPLVSDPFTVVAGAPTRLVVVTGSGQSKPVGTTLTNPLAARAVDVAGNAIPDVAVTWVVSVGGGSVVFPPWNPCRAPRSSSTSSSVSS